ncbi:MAG: hypothetical protein U0794_12185 [Isosphaeraceae bacterium]
MSTGSSSFVRRRAPSARRQRWTTIIFALAVLIPSAFGFSRKFTELVALTKVGSDGTFAIVPVVNYLLASLGFFCLFCWAIFNGMFGDVERPKYDMLETERLLDDEDGF